MLYFNSYNTMKMYCKICKKEGTFNNSAWTHSVPYGSLCKFCAFNYAKIKEQRRKYI